MNWKAYELVYRAMSPVHIGWHTLGYIKLTRHYIPGKAMWGAFTANLVRSGQNNFEYKDYKDIGELFKTDVLVSYFYPAIDDGNGLRAILPRYTDEGLRYGKYGIDDFERLFISSFGQTAILPDNNSAEDKSLHESEFILPIIEENGTSKPVYFIGYIFIKDSACAGSSKMTVGWEGKDINLRKPLSEIFVGGDRKYGWGRLALLDPEKTTNVDRMFDIALVPDKDSLELTISSDHPIPAHTSINQDIKVKGDIEPLVGRDWGEVVNKNKEKISGFGQQVGFGGMCWMPGSVLTKQKTFNIGAYGILTSGANNV